MIWELLFGFLVLVAASYVGTTMALRGFFGRERYTPDLERSDEPPNADERVDADESSASDGPPNADASNGAVESNGVGESDATED